MGTDLTRSAGENNWEFMPNQLDPVTPKQLVKQTGSVSRSPGPAARTKHYCLRLLRSLTYLAASSALCTTVSLNTAFGQAWEIRPTLTLQEEYNDNFDLTVESPIEGFATQLIGGLEVSRLTDIWQFRGYGELDVIRYSSDELENNENYFVGFSSSYNPELTDWNLDGSYSRDTLFETVDLAVTTEGIARVPGNDVDVGLNLPGEQEREVTRDWLTLNPSWRTRLTERSNIQAIYRLDDVSYSDALGTGLNDYRNHRLTLQHSYALTQTNTVVTAMGANIYRAPDADQRYESYGLGSGIDHRFSETTRGGFRVGVQTTSFETRNDEGDETGFLGSVFGSKRTEATSFDARLERALYPSGSGGLRQTDQVILRMRQELSPRLRFLITARAFRSETAGTDTQDERRYLSLEPRLSWALSQSWSVDTFYKYTRQEEEEDPGAADSNAVFISLSYLPLSILDQY